MIIRGADGDDEEKIVEMEIGLCRKYRLARRALYPTLQHADFHRTYKDPERFWTSVCYAAFSGVVLSHNLAHKSLNALLQDFAQESEAHHASWNVVQAEAMCGGSRDRQLRNHTAIALRYACAVADDYVLPGPDVIGRLTPEQFRELNDYVQFVSEQLIPAGKYARLACKRQLDDLSRSTKEREQ
jgi:hypothetical protein